MRWRPTLVLLGIVLLALAYAFFVERRVEPPPPESRLVFPDFAAARERTDRIEILRPRGEATETLAFELIREPALVRWRLAAPVRRRADADLLGGLLRILGELARVREDVGLASGAPELAAPTAPAANGAPAEYGLDEAQAVRLRCYSGKELLLEAELGRVVERPGGKLAYLRRPGEARASLVDARLQALLELPLTDYFSRELLPFPAATIARLTVTPGPPTPPGRPGAGLEPLEFWPTAAGRFLMRARLSNFDPVPATDRVAPGRAEQALAVLVSTHALDWLGPGETPAAQQSCGVGPEALQLQVVELLAPGPAGERRERAWTLRVGDWQDPLSRRVYLLVEGGDEAPFIAATEARFLELLAPEKLRQTRLAAFDASRVNRVELDFPTAGAAGAGGSGASPRRILQQGQAGWELLDGGRRIAPVPPETVRRLLDAIARAEIGRRVPAEAPLRERLPTLRVRIYYGTETRPAEEFALGLEAGKETWAWRPELENEVLYRVDGDLARLLEQPPAAYGPLERTDAFEPETAAALELRGPAPPGGGPRPVFAVQRAAGAAGGTWAQAPAATVPWRPSDLEHLRRLIALTARLRARMLLGPRPAAERAGCGLDPPQYIVRLTRRPAAGAEQTVELELGDSAAGREPFAANLFYARLAGTDELFTVDQAWRDEVTSLLRSPTGGALPPLPSAPAPRP